MRRLAKLKAAEAAEAEAAAEEREKADMDVDAKATDVSMEALRGEAVMVYIEVVIRPSWESLYCFNLIYL
jgi:hypothetical protein